MMQEKPSDIKSIEERVNALKNKDNEEKKRADVYNFSIGIQISIELVSGIITGGAIGYMLKEIFDLNIIFVVCLTILGGIAGFFNVARYLKSINDKDVKR